MNKKGQKNLGYPRKKQSFYKTRLKCKSSARVKIVLKKDLNSKKNWIVKKSWKSWKMLKKM